MNQTRITVLKEFIENYRNISNPFLKEITKTCYDYYYKELMNEYSKLSKHPYPNEYLNINKTIGL